jgi:hypothetical protein
MGKKYKLAMDSQPFIAEEVIKIYGRYQSINS